MGGGVGAHRPLGDFCSWSKTVCSDIESHNTNLDFTPYFIDILIDLTLLISLLTSQLSKLAHPAFALFTQIVSLISKNLSLDVPNNPRYKKRRAQKYPKALTVVGRGKGGGGSLRGMSMLRDLMMFFTASKQKKEKKASTLFAGPICVCYISGS